MGEIIPFPVWIISFPVLKINFEPLGTNKKQARDEMSWGLVQAETVRLQTQI